MTTKWRPIRELKEDGFYLVAEGGAVRAMLYSGGKWIATGSVDDEHGDPDHTRTVRERLIRDPEWFAPVPTPPHEKASYETGMDPGLYRIRWKSGGNSLAAIGMNEDGTRWIAPTNWVAPNIDPTSDAWAEIEEAERVA